MKKADIDILLKNAVGVKLKFNDGIKKGDRVVFPTWHPLELDDERKVRKIFRAYTSDFIEEIIDDNVVACRENFEKEFPNTDYKVFVFRMKSGKVGMGALPSNWDYETAEILIEYSKPLSSKLQQC